MRANTALSAYNAACSYALAGDRERAFSALELAAQRGELAPATASADRDLTSLSGDPRWPALLQEGERVTLRARRLWSSETVETPFQDVLSEDAKIAGLARLWSEAKYNFIGTERLIEVDWDGQLLAYLPKVRAARTTYEYYRVLQQFYAMLGDGHTGVSFPPEIELSRPALQTKLIEGEVVITEVEDEALRRDGIIPGVVITSIDGIPTVAYREREVVPYNGFSTAQSRDAFGFGFLLLMGPTAHPVQLGLRMLDGSQRQRTVPRVDAAARRERSAPPFTHRTLPGNIAYVVLNTFESDRTADEFIAAFPAIAASDGLILDVRDNGGGNSQVGNRVLATLIDAPVATSRWRTRAYRPTSRAWGQTRVEMDEHPAGRVEPDPTHRYDRRKPVVVLSSTYTFSAAEDFLVAFDQSGRGLIVGEPSGGSTGQPLSFRLPGGGRARVCTKRDEYADGRAFVGVGVTPQRRVAPTLADLRAGRDTVLEAAMALLATLRAK